MSRQLENLRASGEDIEEILALIAQKAQRNLGKLKLNKLRIQKGRRVVQGQIVGGLRSNLKQEDVKALKDLMLLKPSPEKKLLYEGKIPNYEVKLDDEVLFRQEQDGTVTTNQLQLEPKPESLLIGAALEETLDSDGDGLSNAEEIAYRTDHLNSDTDGDGIGDASDSDPNNPSANQEKDTAREKAGEIDDIPAAVRVAQRDVEQLPEGRTKQLFKSIVQELGERAKSIGRAVAQKVADYPQWQQNQDVAKTALHSALYSKEVVDTANRFLHYMGVEKWDAGKQGNYKIERSGNELKITSKADGRGVVFERQKGRTTNNLTSKDFKHFKDLGKTLENRLQKVKLQNKQAAPNRSQKVEVERELSM